MEPQRPRCGLFPTTAGSPWLQQFPRLIYQGKLSSSMVRESPR